MAAALFLPSVNYALQPSTSAGVSEYSGSGKILRINRFGGKGEINLLSDLRDRTVTPIPNYPKSFQSQS
jgi:hypothetical protein